MEPDGRNTGSELPAHALLLGGGRYKDEASKNQPRHRQAFLLDEVLMRGKPSEYGDPCWLIHTQKLNQIEEFTPDATRDQHWRDHIDQVEARTKPQLERWHRKDTPAAGDFILCEAEALRPDLTDPHHNGQLAALVNLQSDVLYDQFGFKVGWCGINLGAFSPGYHERLASLDRWLHAHIALVAYVYDDPAESVWSRIEVAKWVIDSHLQSCPEREFVMMTSPLRRKSLLPARREFIRSMADLCAQRGVRLNLWMDCDREQDAEANRTHVEAALTTISAYEPTV